MLANQGYFTSPSCKGLESCPTSFFYCRRVITGSGERVSSWVAAVVIDRFYATSLWDMLLTRHFNQPLSQRGVSISIALCSIAIVVVVWPAVGFCFPTNKLFSSQLVVIFASQISLSHDCTKNMSR